MAGVDKELPVPLLQTWPGRNRLHFLPRWRGSFVSMDRSIEVLFVFLQWLL